MDLSQIGALAGITVSVLSAVYTYGGLGQRVKMLEKVLDEKRTKEDKRDEVLQHMSNTLSRVDERLSHIEKRAWWKG